MLCPKARVSAGTMSRPLWIVVVLMLFCVPSVPQRVRLHKLHIEPELVNKNLVTNASFEETNAQSIPIGWSWAPRNTDATLRVVSDRARSGKRSLFITNGTPLGAHVYGTAEYLQPLPLQAGKRYTLSAYVHSPDPGIAWIGGGSEWQFRMRLPASPEGWQRVSMTFTPGERDVPFVLRINTDSPTKGIWIDDIKLEEGETSTPFCDDSATTPVLQVEPLHERVEIQGDGAFTVSFSLATPYSAEAQLRVRVSRGSSISVSRKLAAGFYRVVIQGEAIEMDAQPRQMVLEVKTAMDEAKARTTVRFYSRARALRLLEQLKQRLPAYEKAVTEMRKAGKPVQWAKVSLTVLQNFARYVEEDLNHRFLFPDGSQTYPEIRRAWMQLDELRQVEAHLLRELRRPSKPVVLWRFQGKRPEVRDGSFVDDSGRPYFFHGYGHFGQVQADIEKLPDYGVNIIQIEVGPDSIFPSEGTINEEPIRQLQQVLQRAEKVNVSVTLLISPHYFPQWMLQRYPHLRKRRHGFLQYCLHAPESQQLLKQYIRALIPSLSRYPSLHSICLSNEPVSFEEPCEYATRDWRRWLQTRHGDIHALNRRWQTTYAQWEDIPLPDPFDGNARNHLPSWYDFIRFNQEFFAQWHQMLADAIREVAPELPIHAKAMTWTLLGDSDVVYGADAYLVAQFSDINGNDSVNFYSHGEGEYAQGWLLNAMSHDLQRSMKNAPVFNTENHLIPDRETRPVPAQHVHTVLWQAAVHGQGATTIWVWERTFDPRSDFAGSIMHRPACAEAVGRVNLLLNRLAREVTALQRAPADVVLIDSVTGKVWDGGAYTDCQQKLYEALTFCGVKVGFISERQLENGQLPTALVLFVANQRHLSDQAVQTLRRYGGRIVFVGDGELLTDNEYGKPHPNRLEPAWRIGFTYGKTTANALHRSVFELLRQWDCLPAVQVYDGSGAPQSTVAWRCAPLEGAWVVNLCNYSQRETTIRLLRNGKPLRYRAPDETRWRTEPIRLSSLETRLLVCE